MNPGLTSKRREKKDVFEHIMHNGNDDLTSSYSTHSSRSNKSDKSDKSEKRKKCKKQKECKTICDRLCLEPPDDACEERRVVHKFKVILGECKVTRDVKITHCITANLDHHIKEYVTCKHEPCVKHTHDEKHTVVDGKCCDVKFPDCDDDIQFEECESKHKHHSSHEVVVDHKHGKKSKRHHKEPKIIF